MALTLWTRYAVTIRILLIAVIPFNALAPMPVIAMAIPEETNSSSVLLAESQGMKGSEGKYSSASLRSPTVFQAGTPVSTPMETASPTEIPTETPTPELSITPTITVETTQTITETLPLSSPTLEGTPTGSSISVPTQTSVLSPAFFADPAQAKAGDRVTFTLTIINKGTLPVTGLIFTNILPEGFNEFQSDDKGFSFDTGTREITWKQVVLDPAQQLLPGGSLSLKYSVLIESQLKEAQIIDTANLIADGLKESLLIQATLILLGVESSLTVVDTSTKS